MGRVVVVEGLDGAGKRTLAAGLAAELAARGADVARIAFPRYDLDVHAALVRDALYGRLGDLADSVYGMAVLFALDRHAAAEEVRSRARTHDAVLVDRYIASNAAYGAARLHEDATGPFVAWVRELETERLAIPVPHLHLLLRVPSDVARQRARQRAGQDRARARDGFESDDGLQHRCAAVYDQLAAAGWLAPWTVLDGSAEVDTAALADAVLGPPDGRPGTGVGQ